MGDGEVGMFGLEFKSEHAWLTRQFRILRVNQLYQIPNHGA